MFQVIAIHQNPNGTIDVDIWLDNTKTTNGTDPDRNYVVSLELPAPGSAKLDDHLNKQLTALAPQLYSTLAVRQPPVDPFAKWKGYTWK